VVRDLPDDHEKAELLLAVAGLLQRAGRAQEAVALAEQVLAVRQQIQEQWRRGIITADAAAVIAAAGHLSKATDVAYTAAEQSWQAGTLMRIAGVLVRSGQPDEAFTMSQQAAQADPDAAGVLVGAARMLADAQRPDHAEILLQQALSALKTADTNTFFAVLPDALYAASLIAPDIDAANICQTLMQTVEWIKGYGKDNP
jgi:tetratricopeptide (TPR) repeat protein